MHEWGITQSIVDKILEVAKKENIKTIKEVEISLGDKSGISEEEFRFCFSTLVKNTLLEHAILKIIFVNSNLVGIESIIGE